MSSTSSAQDYLPSGISVYGGLPTKSQDLAASILFTILFALLLPLCVYRLVNKDSRSLLVFRIFLFVPTRVVSYILRSVEASGTYSVGIFIAEFVLILSGFNLLCEPLVAVMEQHLHASAYNARLQEPFLIQRLLKLMRLGLLAALVLGIYCATLYSSAENSSSTVANIDQYRLAISGLNMGITGLTVVLVLLLHKPFQMQRSGTLFIVGVGLLASITSAYRLAGVVHRQPLLAARTKIYFYVFGALPELLATIPFLAFNLHTVFDLEYKHPSSGPIRRIVHTFRGNQPLRSDGIAQSTELSKARGWSDAEK